MQVLGIKNGVGNKSFIDGNSKISAIITGQSDSFSTNRVAFLGESAFVYRNAQESLSGFLADLNKAGLRKKFLPGIQRTFEILDKTFKSKGVECIVGTKHNPKTSATTVSMGFVGNDEHRIRNANFEVKKGKTLNDRKSCSVLDRIINEVASVKFHVDNN